MKATTALLSLVLMLTAGCSNSSESGGRYQEAVDLDRVLTAFDRAVSKSNKTAAPSPGAGGAATVESLRSTTQPPAQAPADPAKTKAFLALFAAELNAAKLVSTSVGVQMRSDGAIEGFEDKNRNTSRDAGERKLFDIEVDEENKRIVASTTVGGETYRRPRRFGMGGFFMGYMVARMIGGQRSFYRGRARPRFGRMSSRGYHRAASSRARSRRSSSRSSRGARSRGGSRGFRSGK